MMDISRMQEEVPGHFHKGFYLTEDVGKSLAAVENEHEEEIECEDPDAMDYLYTNAEVFLCGSCNLFALALHEEFGYDVYERSTPEGTQLHVFCKTDYKGQDAYIDVRGITTSFLECFSKFDPQSRIYSIRKRDIEQDQRLENEGDAVGFLFAWDVVKKYRSYYDISF